MGILAPTRVTLTRSLDGKWSALGLLALTGVLLFVAPALLSPFRLNLLGKFLAYAIVALGLDLLWGYTGLLSLGQAVFFGLGAYAMGMYLKLEGSGGKLPDFMQWSGLTSLPFFWYPFQSPVIAIGAAVLIPTALAASIGYFLFRSRINSVYFALITQALALIFSTLFIGQQPLIGGTNGLTNFATILGQPIAAPLTQLRLYQVTVLTLLGCYLVCRWLARSRFGKLLVALRDAEERARFCGYDPTVAKLFVFVIAAGMAGLAGALYVPQVGIVNPDALGVILSMTMVVWVAVGGRGTLRGAVLGALVVNVFQTAFSESFPNVWQYLIGGFFIGTVLFFPAGLLGAPTWLVWLVRRMADYPRPAVPRPSQNPRTISVLGPIEPGEVGS